jgi:hypothetical protein
MYAVRKWSVSRAPFLVGLYQKLEGVLTSLDALWLKIGYDRVEKPITFIEKNVKGFLFDCKMCGQCSLRDTGMSCPMNCPKELRNGPCGGVRADGRCEVKPDMRCVWVEAYRGHQLIGEDSSILSVQFPVDHRLKGRSSWLREVRKQRDKEFYEQTESK